MHKRYVGFTIIELLIVIVIISILATLSVLSYSGIKNKSYVSTLQADLTNNAKKLKSYQALYGAFPSSPLGAGNCPTSPNVDNAYCLTTSGSSTVSSYASTSTTFTLVMINNGVSYQITESSTPVAIVPASVTGGTITTITGYKVHTFTASGTLVVSGSPVTVEYLVVGGGGGGSDGGGGAGGLLQGSGLSLPVGSYAITVGNGGAAGVNGGNSSIAALKVAIGGGAGGSAAGSGAVGGSGGGGGTGGAGTVGQGNNGGDAGGDPDCSGYGLDGYIGGGGGAGGVGVGTWGGNGGGAGLTSSITGASIWYAGGGGGYYSFAAGMCYGLTTGTGAHGSGSGANTGGGGQAYGAGNSGVVIVRYAN